MAAAAAVTCPREAESDGRGLGPVDSEAADATAVSVPRSSMTSPSPSTALSVGSDDALLQNGAGAGADEDEEEEGSLPQCKIKRNYTCSHCNYFTQNPRNFLYHLRGVHKEKLRIYECPSCLYASKHSQKLQRHVHMVHVMGKGRKKTTNPKPPKPPKPKKEPSPSPEDFPWDAKEEDDEEGEEEEESVTDARCSQCPFTDKSKALVVRHEQAAHLRKKFYRCAKCNYMTHLRARYTKHVKYHSMPMIKCAMCDFRTPYKWNLDRHYKNHTGDGAFRCSLCNFTADIKQSLTVHEMNHHVPPAAGLAPLPRRRNKVGASDCDAQLEVDADADDVQCKIPNFKPKLETPSGLPVSVLQPSMISDNSNSDGAFVPLIKKSPKIKITPRKIKVQSTQEQNERHNFETDFIHPDDIIHHKNGNVYIKNLKCKKCNFKSAWEGEMARHETKVHGMSRSLIKPPLKKIPRPIPNLIPIQNKLPVTISPTTLPILKIPTIRARVNANSGCSLLKPLVPQSPETCLSEKDLNEICAKSCPNSSLRDFASLIGDENAFKMLDDDKSIIQKQDLNTIKNCSVDPPDPYFESKCDISASAFTLKKKNASFFDQLKEKLLIGPGDPSNLVCSCCGHESKCLSESLRHEKLHTSDPVSEKGALPVSTCIQSIPSGAELSSTRCQRCRQRCKTSADLVVHLQTCLERSKSPTHIEIATDVKIEMGFHENNDEEAKVNDSHPMVNKVFVWNDIQPSLESETELNEIDMNGESYSTSELSISITQDDMDESDHSNSPNSESSLVGVETAPGYGAVMGTPDAEGQSQELETNISTITTNNGALAVKKVFKCPHCSFWASTASRFHVHIVGHLNKKPFECSLCAYRSNWRWDITKHIKLKSIRDENHEKAKVLMTDETGRRNYSKYNKYLTVMRVQEPLSTQAQQVLPAPPQLTRAPDRPSGNLEPQSVSGTLRPPPPLRAAHHIVFPGPPALHKHEHVNLKKTQKRPARILFYDEDQPPSKKPVTETKKTLWKCKKCNFRDLSRAQVLAHVKEHYQQRLLIQPAGTSEASVERGSAPFKCGHCHQVSNWKHVIQRHCRLKHSGDVRVVTDSKEEDHDEKSSGEDNNNELDMNETQTEDNLNSCTMCPFVAITVTDMKEHLQHHSPHPDAIFKCFSCPYFVFLKSDLLEHMKLHGVNETDDSIEAIQEKMSAQMHLLTENDKNMKSQQPVGHDGSPNKRYKCVNCPYVSNSKSQFLYHKQFHRPRGAPFKCGLCSYNVSRRHLLHQHLRVHGILIPPQKSPSKCGKENLEGVEDVEEISTDQSSQVQTPIDTHDLPHIPLVWVSRCSKFFKMYKCRFCPHVNMRKANIQEHEKMHQVRNKVITTQEADGSIKTKEHTPTQHHCPDCNYVCNNAGVLSSHAKVHQGVYGTVYALVDSSRSDESQLQELTASLKLPVESPQVADESNISFISESDPEIAIEVNLNNSATSKDTLNVETDILSAVNNTGNSPDNLDEPHILHFCSHCPARFMFEKEIKIHSRFHELNLAHQCESCTYTSRQRPYLLAHQKVHTSDYQEKTNTLCNIYQVSSQYQRPKTALIVEGPGVSGSVWIVVDAQKHSIQSNKKKMHSGPKQVEKHYSCTLCPAKFIKSVALQYHISLHGGGGMYKCKYCDYSVKTYGNLVKHEMIHENMPSQKSGNTVSSPERNIKDKLLSESVPLSGTDLFQQKSEASKLITEDKLNLKDNQHLHVDPQFGILMHGSPEFIYPTYLKNGRMKEKRYKCHKCPSAFEKREQYKTHLSLHGAKQRYKCEKCDYSVKYYANYIQHMRKHKNNDEAQAARKLESPQTDSVPHYVPEEKEDEIENEVSASEAKEPPVQHSVKSIGNSLKKPGPIQMSVADRQMLMLMQLKRSDEPIPKTETFEEQIKQKFWCPHCPYSNNHPDALDNHVKRHISVSAMQSNFVCNFCDYSVPQLHLLREHNKLHFSAQIRFTPECYMKCKEIKIWTHLDDKENTLTTTNKIQVFSTKKLQSMESKNILFQDNGKKLAEFDRFYPSLLPKKIIDNGDKEKFFIDIDTSEPLDMNFSDDVNAHDEDMQNINASVHTEPVSSQGTEETNEPVEEENNDELFNGEGDEKESVESLVKEKLIGEQETNFVEKEKITENSEYSEQDTYLNDNSNRSDISGVSGGDDYDYTDHDVGKQPNSSVMEVKSEHHYSETKTDRTSESD